MSSLLRWGHGTPKPPKTPDGTMTLTEHLAELRVRIVRCALAVTVGAVMVLAFYDPILRFLREPYTALCKERGGQFCGGIGDDGAAILYNLGPLEGFGLRMRIGMYGGLLLALPVVMWQIWRFVVPALKANEKKYAIPFILSSIVLFALGALLAYLTLEKALEFLISWAGQDVQATFQVSKYVSLVGLMAFAFGVGFQFPILLVFLQLVGVLQPQQLLGWWRYAIVSVAVAAAVITPSGDPISMTALAVPMLLLYFASVGIGFFVERRRRRAEQPAPA
jgi:sec-independent protein translocase protein TatC